MKRFTYIASFIFLTFALLVSCEKEIMDYEGKDAIYFDVQYGAEWGNENVWTRQLYTIVPFGSIQDSVQAVSLKICIAGQVMDYDRPFRVEIVKDSTNAEAGVDYLDFSENQVIKAGENHTRLTFTAKRSARMLTDTVYMQLRLQPNEHFELAFDEVGTIPGRWSGEPDLEYNQNYDPAVHSVYMHNMLVSPPVSCWNKVQFGTYSGKKYQLMMDITGFTKEDFNNVGAMQTGRQKLIARMFSKYLMEQYQLGLEKKDKSYWILDEDGTMMWTNGVSWGQGVNPDDMVLN